MAELSSKYELSVWEDITHRDKEDDVSLSYFDEKKLAVIAADGADNKIFAYDISLNENINGEKTLTFSLPSKYRDNGGVLLDNPLLQYLVSERKVKLRDGELPPIGNDVAEWAAAYNDDDIWHDFIIKDISEDSEKYVNTYTCKELHVNELGKNGYSVLMDDELGNNYGTLQELGDYAMEGSGWRVEVDGTLYERVNEPLFYATTPKVITVEQLGNAQGDAIPAEKIFYTFYSQLTQHEQEVEENGNEKTILVWKIKPATELPDGNVQVIYSEKTLTYDDQYVLVDDEDINYLVQAEDLADLQWIPCGSEIGNSIHNQAIQGRRFVDSNYSFYDPVAEKQVEDYGEWIKDDTGNLVWNHKAYVYRKTEFIKPVLINNLIANSSEFVNSSGWSPAHDRNGRVGLATFPIFTSEELIEYQRDPDNYEGDIPTNYLTPSSDQTIYNHGLRSNGIQFIKGQKFLIQLETAEAKLVATTSTVDNTTVTNYVWYSSTVQSGASWTVELGYLDSTNAFFPITLARVEGKDAVYTVTDIGDYDSNYSVSRHEPVLALIYDKKTDANGNPILPVLPYLPDGTYNPNGTGRFYQVLKNVVLAPYYEDDEGNPIKPGDAPDLEPVISYVAYTKTYGAGGEEINEIATWHEGDTKPDYIGSPKKNGYGAVRHINVKESNYFNIANDLAELFGWWVNFKIPHRNDGKLYRENGKIDKVVRYTRYHGNDYLNSAGFKYGINEKGIKRTNDSKGLVTKLIVKDSYQELAENGIVSIRGAKSNPTGDTNIYNFTYYINHGLLKQFDVLNDLYGMSGTGTFNYYNEISKLMQLYAPIEQELVAAEGALQAAKDGLANTELMITEATQEIESKKSDYDFYLTVYKDYPEGAEQHPKCASIMAAICSLIAQKQQFEQDLEDYQKQVDKYNLLIYGEKEVDEETYQYKGMYFPSDITVPGYDDWRKPDGSIPSDYEKLTEGPLSIAAEAFRLKKKSLDSEFYAKYSRYIQEGTWSDDKYVDSELYYLDGKKVSDQNAYPKTTYTISVVDVSTADKYKAYTFKVGDRTYVEDTEFFGYQYVGENNILTPVKKEVIVSERKRFLDNPSKSTITVKTYKNQFEDLFSKITATTQSLSNASGGYQRAANVVENDGSIKIESLEQAMANNAWTIASSSTNQNVEWNNGDGITVTDLKNSLLKVRITSRGIATSTDGGQTWTTGISAQGINTSLLQAGAISTDVIQIKSPQHQNNTAFNWDDKGISAYSAEGSNKFVRFDENGIYGTTKGISLDQQLNSLYNGSSASTYGLRSSKNAIDIIRENSNFSLTWDGLELSYQDNKTSLSSTRGLEVLRVLKNSQGQDIYITYPQIISWNNGEAQVDDVTTNIMPVLQVGYYAKKEDENSPQTVHAGFAARDVTGRITTELTSTGLRAIDADLSGKITAKSGQFTGKIQVGSEDSTAYIGNLGDGYVFKSGTGIQKVWIKNDGTIEAASAKISGTIIADSGEFIGTIRVGKEGSTAYIGYIQDSWEDEEGNSHHLIFKSGSQDNPNVYITNDGYIIANYGVFTKAQITEATITKTYFEKGDTNSYIGLPTDDENGVYIKIKNTFSVDGDGLVTANKLTLASGRILLGHSVKGLPWDGDPTTEKNYHFLAYAKEGDTIPVLAINDDGLRINATLQSANFDKAAEAGWRLTSEGDAIFRNVSISGTLETVAFKYKKISAVGGVLDVTPTLILPDDMTPSNTTQNNGLYYYTFDDYLIDDDQEHIWAPVNRIKIVLPDGTQYEAFRSSDKTHITSFPISIPRLPKGTLIVSLSAATNRIRITAENVIGPRIEMLGPKAEGDWYAPRVIIGALDRDDDVYGYFADSIHGKYGLYADSVFLTGRLFLPNAGIDNEINPTEPGNAIRFWAGSSSAERENAPFKVYHDGRVEATEGVFTGKIMAGADSIISGTLQAAGVVLMPDDELTDYSESHFPFYLKKEENNQTTNTLLAGVDEYGIHSWSGFTLFSAESQNRMQNATQDWRTHYPYSDSTDRTLWPSVSFNATVNDSALITKRLSTWLENNQNAMSTMLTGTGLAIRFTSISGLNYSEAQLALSDSKPIFEISNADGEKTSLIGSRIQIKSDADSDDTVLFTPQGLQSKKETLFGNSIKIVPLEKGIVFHYFDS